MYRGLIALDADGVLLDFNLAYGRSWEKAFGVKPRLVNPNAYWAVDRWGVPRLTGAALDRLRATFDDEFWTTVPAIDGAIDACHTLCEAGYELVCVSALPSKFEAARLKNLQDLGFPIKRVIATDNDQASVSPKAQVLDVLKPEAFVDDYLPYLKGVHPDIHSALILRDPHGSPNQGADLSLASSQHVNLAQFSAWWVQRRAVGNDSLQAQVQPTT
ncbi:HAD family hydrolase [Curvibacter sp. HBC28]|uniref:HAD family hydrolase n=1 Tax=Curvibacter microcysteis TaxID=3026419 RepID=A0ABT5M9W9_9BURK|nr:HAD family hydrolase [Curvibacter sp. HBC28]MDD0813380.1 HAD family hydrolase [Curvibacter sp. HBC28]